MLLPCFLTDNDNSNVAGTDESQLSQPVDIVTPLINPNQSSSERIHSPCLPATNSIQTDQNELTSISIADDINQDSQSDSPVIIIKRNLSKNSCLTENQKDKLRTRNVLPPLCDESSNTQSLSCTMDTTTNESTNSCPANSTADSSSIVESSTMIENESRSMTETDNNNNDEDIPEESSIVRKLRRSNRPSTSARKSLATKSKLKSIISSENEIITTDSSIPDDPSQSSSVEIIKTRPLKGILKRLSPTKPRQDNARRVAFHDKVRVLLFTSPIRRDINGQQQKKISPNTDELKKLLFITKRRPNPMNNNDKHRSSKLFDFSQDSKPQVF